MTNLTTAAWVGHDLALATGLGSGLFKQMALPKALSEVTNDRQRAEVLATSWKTFAPVGGVALAIAATTWLIGRFAISGRSIDEKSRALVLAKDICVTGAVATGIAGMSLDFKLTRESREGIDRIAPTTGMTSRTSRLLDIATAVGIANTVFIAGALGLTTVLASKAGKSMKWSFVSRLLP